MSDLDNKVRTRIALFVSFVSAIALPYGFLESVGLGTSNFHVRASFWEFINSFYYTGPRLLSPDVIWSSIPYWALRILIVYVVYKYYRLAATKGHVILTSLVLESPPFFLSLPAIIAASSGSPAYQIIWPFPILLLISLLLVYLLPPRQATDAFTEE